MLALLKKHPLIFFIVGLITGLLIWGFWPQPIMVEGIAAKYAPMTVSIEEEGRTRLIDRYVISASVDGVTCRQQLKVGDTVKQGQVLLGITPLQSQVLDSRSRNQAQAQVAAAKSALHAAQEQANAASASAQLASNELTRLQPLMAQALISREAFDKAQTQVQTTAASKRSANFSVEVAKYELEAAGTALQYSAAVDSKEPTERVQVRSPINGKILKVVSACEGPVRTGDPLLEVGDPSALEIEVDVLSADAVKIKSGMKVLFDRWGGDKPLEGRVRIVEPVGFTKVSALGVEEQRVLIISDFVSRAELWNLLGDGYRVEANFILWQQENVLQIPASSLFRYKGGWAVFIIESDLAVRREVKIGQRNGLIAQILEGINKGELVINHPSDEVDDGKRVEVRLFE
ncbi:HlyD family efflux transporter periplasmic adaptor subunit [Colwellia sp. MB02u-6]|uniref:efflux RND transporter periplasmic adaptor subunit n=1 Tax=Colwellia sp. MB02u-6 TaxID=2759824 RepID=UPI0015F5F466|nr:HlyD family efflux transporter periplasmic adaptor subunit [Colwellia sp. MB02u-6]MBA6327981.1 HlyD family efflux transporter periplasmic adaptor subunit [Colwellia sp. MB02u-6]